MDKFISQWEKQKKDNHGKHCHDQQTHFSLFVFSVDGMLGKEAQVVITSLSWLTAPKMDKPILHMRGLINGNIAIIDARSYSHMIRGARMYIPLRDWGPDWDP